MRCLIVGGSGFVGRALSSDALRQGYEVRLALRRPLAVDETVGDETKEISSLSVGTDWTAVLRNVETVVNLAARVLVMNDKSSDPLAEFRRMNFESIVALARQAATASSAPNSG